MIEIRNAVNYERSYCNGCRVYNAPGRHVLRIGNTDTVLCASCMNQLKALTAATSLGSVVNATAAHLSAETMEEIAKRHPCCRTTIEQAKR